VRSVQAVMERIRAEFMEMPGLRLTMDEVQRLCGVEPTVCKVILDSLVDAKFLRRQSNGTYARVTEGANTQPRPAQQPEPRRHR
jgi:hypothetical protein